MSYEERRTQSRRQIARDLESRAMGQERWADAIRGNDSYTAGLMDAKARHLRQVAADFRTT